MTKSLDGIKKLNSPDWERSRRLVLKTIGEKDKNIRQESRIVSHLTEGRRLDGISTKNTFSLKTRPMPEVKNGINVRDKAEIKKVIGEKKSEKTKEGLMREKIKKIQESKFRDAELKRKQQEARLIKETELRRLEKEKLEAKAAEETKRKLAADERKRQERTVRIIKEEKLERKRLNEEKARQEKAKQKLGLEREIKNRERRKKVKLALAGLIKKIKEKAVLLTSFLRILAKYCRLPVLGILILYTAAYLAFASALLFLNIDNKYMRRAGAFFPPVPALISQNWAVDYFSYVDQAKRHHLDDSLIKKFFIEKAVLEDIYYRLGISPWLNGEEAARAEAERKFITGEEFNRVAIARARKIHEIVSAGDFFGAGEKHADKKGALDMPELIALGLDSVKLLDYSSGDITPVLFGSDGYYILQAVGGQQYNYIFVKAKTLEDYIEEQKNQTRVWKLALD